MSDSIFVRLAVGRLLAEIRRQTVIRRGQRALLRQLLDGHTATVDDVVVLLVLPPETDRQCLDVIPRALAEARRIEPLPNPRSAAPDAWSSTTIWTLGNREDAEKWLVEHVDLPAVTTASQLVRSQNEAGSPGTAARDSQTL